MKERWCWIKGYEGLYKISDFGRIKSYAYGRHIKKRGKEKTLCKGALGYFIVCLSLNKKHKNYRVGRLTAQHFIPNPLNKPEVNHIDGDKTNDNLSNLEWVTRSENAIHAHRVLGTQRQNGELNPYAKLNNNKVIKIRKLYKIYKYEYAEIAKIYKVSRSNIWQIVNNKTWTHL